MEITTRPRSRRWQRLAGRLSLLAAVMALAVLLPASLGFDQHVVGDDAMGGSLSRGALVLQRPVHSAGQLEPGDVITFAAPDTAGGARLTRRVVSVDDPRVTTRGDARPDDDPVTLEVGAGTGRSSRAVVVIPFAGYPQLWVPGLSWAVLVLLVTAAAATTLVAARRQAGRDHVRVARVADRPTSAVT